MAKKRASTSSDLVSEKREGEARVRRPREYRFEIVNEEKVVTQLGLVLTCRVDAHTLMEFLNTNPLVGHDDVRYRFCEVIIEQ